jgi:hypothetical protein
VFPHLTRLQLAHPFQFPEGLPWQILMFADNKGRLPPSYAQEKRQGTHVAVSDPELTGLNRGDNLRKQSSLLGMTVLTRENIDCQPRGRVEHD